MEAATDIYSSALERLPGLLPHHVTDLRKSGLSDETIAAAGIYSETDHLKLATLLNWKKYDRQHGAALVFPFRDELGIVVLNRVKPDNAANRNGTKCKYLSPSG